MFQKYQKDPAFQRFLQSWGASHLVSINDKSREMQPGADGEKGGAESTLLPTTTATTAEQRVRESEQQQTIAFLKQVSTSYDLFTLFHLNLEEQSKSKRPGVMMIHTHPIIILALEWNGPLLNTSSTASPSPYPPPLPAWTQQTSPGYRST